MHKVLSDFTLVCIGHSPFRAGRGRSFLGQTIVKKQLFHRHFRTSTAIPRKLFSQLQFGSVFSAFYRPH